MRKKNYARAIKIALAWDRRLRLGQWQLARGEVCDSCKYFGGIEGKAEKVMGFLMVRNPSELGQVAFGSATQCLLLGDRKVTS